MRPSAAKWILAYILIQIRRVFQNIPLKGISSFLKNRSIIGNITRCKTFNVYYYADYASINSQNVINFRSFIG